MDKFPCPECGATISDKNYDSSFEMYECPKCEGMFTFNELLEGDVGGSENGSKPAPKAKGKIRAEELEADEKLADELTEAVTKKVKATKKEERHRDEVKTGMVLNIIADEIEAIAEELGVNMDRANAREFYAMNLYRPLMLAGTRAREQEVPHKLCEVHS